jgi:hypothetical protein
MKGENYNYSDDSDEKKNSEEENFSRLSDYFNVNETKGYDSDVKDSSDMVFTAPRYEDREGGFYTPQYKDSLGFKTGSFLFHGSLSLSLSLALF